MTCDRLALIQPRRFYLPWLAFSPGPVASGPRSAGEERRARPGAAASDARHVHQHRRVVLVGDGHRVEDCGADVELVNRFLPHLGSRAFSPATVRAYTYDLLNFLRFLAGRDAGQPTSWR